MFFFGATLMIYCGGYWHYGIFDGLGNVIHNSKRHGKVVIEPLHSFSEGREVVLSEEIQGRDASQAVLVAKNFLGMPYALSSTNCEHFVRMCHGLEVQSTQVQKYLLTATSLAVAVRSNNPTVQLGALAVSAVSALTPPEKSPLPNAIVTFCIFVLGVALAGS